MGEPVPPGTIGTHTASDGYRWHFRYYSPPASIPSQGSIIYLHGIQSHGGWYLYSCNRLAQAGYHVWFLDRRGSGLNAQARGDTPSFYRLLDDIAEFLGSPERLRTCSVESVFLLGVSWGAKLAAAMPAYRPGLVHGVALLCPGFFPCLTRRIKLRSQFVGLVAALMPRLSLTIPLNDPALFTATPRWQQFLRNDPLALHRATARMLHASQRLDRFLHDVPLRFHIPVLLQLAEKDRIIDNQATRKFVETFATSDRKIIEYSGAHHTLEFEEQPGRYVDDLIQWLGQHSLQH